MEVHARTLVRELIDRFRELDMCYMPEVFGETKLTSFSKLVKRAMVLLRKDMENQQQYPTLIW